MTTNATQIYSNLAYWVSGGGGSVITGATNLGGGAGIFDAVVGTNLTFKSLVAGSGVVITPSATEITISTGGGAAWLLGGNALPTPQTLSSTGNVNLQSDAGDISLLAINPGAVAAVQGDTATFTGNVAQVTAVTGNLTLGSVAAAVDILAATEINLDSISVKMPSIASATAANVLYYDSTTKEVTYGAAPTAPAGWLTDGTNTGVGLLFGTNTSNGWSYQAAGIPFASVSTSGNTSYSGGLYANGIFEVHSPDPVIIQTNLGSLQDLTVQADKDLYLTAQTGSFIGQATLNTLFFTTATFNTSSADFVADASNNANVLAGSQLILRSNLSTFTLSSLASNGNIFARAGFLDISTLNVALPGPPVGDINITAQNRLLLEAFDSEVFITSNTGNVSLNNGVSGNIVLNVQPTTNLKIQNIPEVIDTKVLYYNTSTSDVTYGDPAAAGVPWSVFAGTSSALLPNEGLILTNAGLVTLALPVTSSVGEVYRITGITSGLFTITQGAGQSIRLGSTVSTVGAGGSLSSQSIGDSLEIVCVTANLEYQVVSSVGNFTIV